MSEGQQIEEGHMTEQATGATENVFDKYRNPDKRCGYPFTPDPAGYCWSYANHVDGKVGFEDMESICEGCDRFEPSVEGWS